MENGMGKSFPTWASAGRAWCSQQRVSSKGLEHSGATEGMGVKLKETNTL